MKNLLWCILMLCCCSSVLAAESLTGTWRSAHVAADGNKSYTYFELVQKGDQLSGTVLFPWGDLPLIECKIQGSHVHFAAAIDNARFTYDGEVVNGMLHLSLRYHDGRETTLVAERAQGGFQVPARIEPPTLHAVPYNGLAATPPMGWNSWNHFHGDVDDAIVRGTADAMVSSGMREVGYTYIVIDDTWEGQRDAQGVIHPNKKFPDMKALADYVHSKGLKFGMYSAPGPKTCADYEGSYGHEEQDAKTFAQWGVDYLKYDWCSAFRIYKDSEMRAVYQKMGDALQATGRPIVYAICQSGKDNVWTWGALAGGNLWRTTDDIADNWKAMSANGFSQDPLADYAGPGHWNDPDMLEIGNGGMTDDEYRTHMSLWAMLAAPLMAGNDLRSMSKETASILANPEVIAIDQDTGGQQARRIKQIGDVEVWKRSLKDGETALALINRGSQVAEFSAPWSDAGISKPAGARNLWEQRDISVGKSLEAEIKPHGVLMLRLKTE